MTTKGTWLPNPNALALCALNTNVVRANAARPSGAGSATGAAGEAATRELSIAIAVHLLSKLFCLATEVRRQPKVTGRAARAPSGRGASDNSPASPPQPRLLPNPAYA